MKIPDLLRHGFVRVAPDHVRGALSATRRFLFAQGLYATMRTKRPNAPDGSPIPWYTYPAIAYLEQIDLSAATVFEYGSGNSSLFWAGRVRALVSIEHDKTWYDEMAPLIGPRGVDYRFIESRELYVASPGRDTFDVVIIDGEWRSDCVSPARSALNPGGFIIFDNADWFPSDARRLRESGLIQVDFTGFGPINAYMSTTSIFLDPGFRPKPVDVMPRVGVAGLPENVRQ